MSFGWDESPQSTKVAVALAAVAVVMAIYSRLAKPSIPLPPGPRGWPIVGCMFELPAASTWLWLSKQHQKYGPIISFPVLGGVCVSIGDYETCREVLEKKAALTSGRPANYIFDNFVYRARAFGFQTFTPAVPTGRKVLQPMFADVRGGRTEAFQQFEAICTLTRIMENPKGYRDEVQRFVTSEATLPLFGHHVDSADDPFVERLRVAIESLFVWAHPYSSMINFLPGLDKWLPEPLAPWRKTATDFGNYYGSVGASAVDLAIESGKKGIKSWITDLRSGPAQAQIDSVGLKTEVVALELVQAASETTFTVLLRFIQAWVLFPQQMAAAQNELDNLVGSERMPTFEDRDQLPLLEAALRETMRWSPPIPLGLTHTCTEDMQVKIKDQTYVIPKGALIWGNSWELDRVRKSIEDPGSFNLANQLDAQGKLKNWQGSHHAFGFGRRICIGQPFAERGLYTMAAHLLWAFNCKAGSAGPPDLNDYRQGIAACPNPFDVNLTPRSEARAEHIKSEWENMDKDLANLS